MANTLIQVVVQLSHLSEIPKDRDVNTFHFYSDGVGLEADLAEVLGDLEDFYNANPANHPPSWYLSPCLSRAANAHSMVVYMKTSLQGFDPFGSPVVSASWTLGEDASGPGNALPNEVACVVSIHGDLTDVPETQAGPPITRPANRRRGRFFFGPLDLRALEGVTATNETIPDPLLIEDLTEAAKNLAEATAAANVPWVVWSREDAAVYPVVGGFVDNAFDTQRRRGNAPTARTSWSI